ncbi:hypothetical protein IU405_14510 [Polaribacter sp. BAL334]|uniref:hypothetical protein n=1 Tax=Polaribacter sp. BAL334 TaxID=1708178 RepID=UPI0018D241D2|nr:hypothetical protein [Polaribacter sp. BAL334]MBG7613463.1 hypothetical protein [Polaribacter sp. BAL334]
MKPEEIRRIYHNTDAEMTATARVIHGLLVSDLPKFTEYDSTFSADFADLFLSAIDNADTLVANTTLRSMLAQKTESIQWVMEKAKTKYADVKYFAQKTFATSLATQNEFGLNDYLSARRNAVLMIQFLEEMHKSCVKYQTELVANGLEVAAIAEIQTIKTALETANTEQEIFKKQRTKLTEDRVKILNNCYEFITKTNAAAQRVYKDDFAKRNQFVYSSASIA